MPTEQRGDVGREMEKEEEEWWSELRLASFPLFLATRSCVLYCLSIVARTRAHWMNESVYLFWQKKLPKVFVACDLVAKLRCLNVVCPFLECISLILSQPIISYL